MNKQKHDEHTPDSGLDAANCSAVRYYDKMIMIGCLLFIVGIPLMGFLMHPVLGFFFAAIMGLLLAKCALEVKRDIQESFVHFEAWKPIESAPKDGTEFIVYCQPAHGLKHMASVCAWHEDAGFCVDELREPTLWIPLPNASVMARPDGGQDT